MQPHSNNQSYQTIRQAKQQADSHLRFWIHAFWFPKELQLHVYLDNEGEYRFVILPARKTIVDVVEQTQAQSIVASRLSVSPNWVDREPETITTKIKTPVFVEAS